MAQRHSDWSAFSNQYSHLPIVDERGEKRLDLSLLSFLSTVINARVVLTLASLHCVTFTPVLVIVFLCNLDASPAMNYPCRSDHYLDYSFELFMRPASYWWTNGAMYQQQDSGVNRNTLTWLSIPVLVSLYPFMHYADTLTPHHHLILYLEFHYFPSEVWTSYFHLSLDATSPGEPYLPVNTHSGPDKARHRGQVRLSQMGSGGPPTRTTVAGGAVTVAIASPHMPRSLVFFFWLLPPCHSAQVPSLTYLINF